MSSIALPVGRIPTLLSSTLAANTLDTDQANLLNIQQQVATGNRLNLPSDDPAATVGIMGLNQQIADNTQYTTNLNFASGFLGQADSTLTQVSTLITQAQSIANSQVGVTATADQRSAQAQVVDSMLSQLMSLANTQYQGQSVFGGQIGSANPFVAAGGGYKYVGTTQGQGILTPDGSSLPYTVDGNSVFGGTSAEVTGSQNLTPALTTNTPLSTLAGATLKGVTTGPVYLHVGSASMSVDLSNASSVGDVVNDLNAGLSALGSNGSVSISGGSLVINGDSAQTVSINDAANSSAGADLGINVSVAAGSSTTGAALQPQITATTPLSSLRNGAGIDPSGIIINNGANAATITLAGPPALNTVGDLLNAINASGTNVTASINSNGTGINVQNPVSGNTLTIGENGGNTATQLGIRSFDSATTLASLNGGTGVTPISQTIGGPTGTIDITKTDGAQFSVNLSGVTNSNQLIAAINSASGNSTVTAALNATGNGITLTDSSGGSGNISVAAGSDYVSNGTNLGIGLPATGAGNTLTGSNITFSTDDFSITRKDGTSFTVSLAGSPAPTTIQDVINLINNAPGNSGPNAVVAGLNSTGNGISLTDPSTGSGALTVASLNASPVASQLGILQTASASTPGTITGADVNPVAPTGLFASLIQLRNALQNNDTAGINQAAAALQTNSQQVITANGVVAAREQDIQTRQGSVTTEQTQLQQSLSLLQDTDMTTAITQYQTLATAFQAALQVTAQDQNLSLLNFLQ